MNWTIAQRMIIQSIPSYDLMSSKDAIGIKIMYNFINVGENPWEKHQKYKNIDHVKYVISYVYKRINGI